MARPIRMPRPRPVDEPTLLGGLAQVFMEEQDARRRRELEDEDRERRIGREDLQDRATKQRMGVEYHTTLRNVFGMEEVGGNIVPGSVPERPAALEPPSSIGTMARGGGPGVGVRAQLQPRTETEPSLVPERAPSTRTQFQDTGRRRLEPARDPTIVNPELLAPSGTGEFDFSDFETKLGFPAGSLAAGFEQNPVGTLNIIKEASGAGGIPTSVLNSIRGVIETRIRAVEAQIEMEVLSADDEAALRDEIDELTIGLIEAATGGSEFDFDTALDELLKIFPEATEDELTERALRMQRVRRGAAGVSRRIRGQLEPTGR